MRANMRRGKGPRARRTAAWTRAACSRRFSRYPAASRDRQKAGAGRRANIASMTDQTDIILFTYALIVVGFVAGLRMLYAGAIERRALFVGGKAIEPKQLVSVGSIFATAGLLATS